jgi:ATP-dependent Lon protease
MVLTTLFEFFGFGAPDFIDGLAEFLGDVEAVQHIEWDNIAFDEVAGIKVKDLGTIQILKDYMANGRFSLGTEVIATASLAFIGNIDNSIAEVVRSAKHDLFKPLPVEFDLAVIHRFHLYLPGWEISGEKSP